MLRLPLIWKLLLVPVLAVMGFAAYLVYSSLVLSGNNARLREIRDIQFPVLHAAEENIDSLEEIIGAFQAAASSGETDALETARITAAQVRERYAALQDIDTARRDEIRKLADEFDSYFSPALDIAQQMTARSGIPDTKALLKMRTERDRYITHLTAFRVAAEQNFNETVKTATGNAERARILGPVIGIIMLVVLLGLTLVVTRGILALEKQIVSISEETQQRIGQELHDNLGQDLTGIAFKSKSLSQNLSNQGNPNSAEAAKVTTLINEAIHKTRNLAHNLYPEKASEGGLPAMLEHLATSMESIYPVECSFINDGGNECRPDDRLAIINLYRIAQEAVNNAVKHSGATKITLTLKTSYAVSTLDIDDNGCGIRNIAEAIRKGGLGMRIMQYRASLLGAILRITTPPGGGTRISIRLPRHEIS